MTIYDKTVCPSCNNDNTAVVAPINRGARWCFDCCTTFDRRQVFVPATSK